VNQNDINNAKAKVSTNNSTAQQTLDSQTKGDDYSPINATFSVGTPTVSSSANVGDVANSVTVTETVTYTVYGVQQAAFKSLIDSGINSQINTTKQSILNDGLSNASYNVINQSTTSAAITVSTTAEVGPQLNTSAIISAAAGQKSGTIQSQLSNNPDVTGVTVHFSPFWVSTAPKNTSHITIQIAKPTTTQSSNSNASNP
jgi:divalent metal cation (Fe/Co/Zn/Cd) transporter